MRAVLRVLAASGIAAGVVCVGLPAAAAPPEGMVLQCADGRSLTRSNGAAWWGLAADGSPDGTVYVMTHLLVADLQGRPVYEQSYGLRPSRTSSACVAQHGPFSEQDYPGSVWTVTVVRTASSRGA